MTVAGVAQRLLLAAAHLCAAHRLGYGDQRLEGVMAKAHFLATRTHRA